MPQNNPLKQFFRQPAIYLQLPSKGAHWPDGSLDMPENQELPVFPMTAFDEITYRTPDALFNGQAVVNVVQSCIPAIKDAWHMPGMDLNSILIAVRIASYGHDLNINAKCPNCETESDFSVDLRMVLDRLSSSEYDRPIEHGDLEIYLCPISYRHQNEINMNQFTYQRQIQQVQLDDTINEEEKIKRLNDVLAQISNLTLETIKYSISAIRAKGIVVTESHFIDEFLANCDRRLYNEIRDTIIKLRGDSEIKPFDIQCPNCSHKWKQELTLDQAAFFRRRLLTTEPEEVSKLVDQMEQEADNIRKQSIKMSWYMRGGATYEDVMTMSQKERGMVADLIKENLETTKTSKLPFF